MTAATYTVKVATHPWMMVPHQPGADTVAGMARAAYDAADAETQKAERSSVKGDYQFRLSGADKATTYKGVTAETLDAYLSEVDPVKRAAILTDAGIKPEPKLHKSAVTPSIAVWEEMRDGYLSRARAAITDRPVKGADVTQRILTELSTGVLVVPTAARGKNATSATKSDPAAVTLATAASIFPDDWEDSFDSTEPATSTTSPRKG